MSCWVECSHGELISYPCQTFLIMGFIIAIILMLIYSYVTKDSYVIKEKVNKK